MLMRSYKACLESYMHAPGSLTQLDLYLVCHRHYIAGLKCLHYLPWAFQGLLSTKAYKLTPISHWTVSRASAELVPMYGIWQFCEFKGFSRHGLRVSCPFQVVHSHIRRPISPRCLSTTF